MPPPLSGWVRVLRSDRAADTAAVLLITAFGLVNLIGLDRMPLVNGDEPWIAEPGLHFWRTGVFASELQRGFFGIEQHFLLHAPLFSIIVGGAIALFGPGLFQVRLVSLTMATLTAALTYALGRRLLSSWHALLAVLILTTWRVAPGVKAGPAGVPLVDLGRLARYDIAVPVFCVTAFMLVLPLLSLDRSSKSSSVETPGSPGATGASRWRPRARLALAGLCVGLGISCHPAGVAWVGILCAALAITRGWREALVPSAWILAGTGIGLLPYGWWVWTGWHDFLQQQRYVGDRWNVISPQFYVWNVVHEWRRYGQIGRGLQYAQPGAWLLAISGLAGLWILWRRPDRFGAGGRVLLVGVLVGAGLFALGLKPKLYHYVATLWPLLALAAAVGLAWLLGETAKPLRTVAIVLLALALADGLRGWNRVTLGAASVTSYRALCDRLAAEIPPDARVLALPSYWLCLESHVRAYRSLFGPMLFASPRFAGEHEPIAELLDETDANVVVLDAPLLTFLRQAFVPTSDAHYFVNGAAGLRDYVQQRSVRRVVIDDPSYGRFEIHYLRQGSNAAGAARK